MCGIAGFVDFRSQSSSEVLKSMTDALYHRGPDDCGYTLEVSGSAQVGLGHRRLSILDLSNHGHQPMMHNDLVIIYNGEVYNFIEIRERLEKLNYKFDSNSDTEVILKAYDKWGLDMVQYLNGMFAIAILDKTAKKLTLIRDRAGVKPLFWYKSDDGLFIFASELKSFHQHPCFNKELNFDGLALFLQYGYIPQPHTIFNNCYKLKAGYSLTIDLVTQSVDESKYWDVFDSYRKSKLDISENEAAEETERLLSSACEYRMVSDVPVGIFLSGGYDSSLVTALLQKNRTEKLKTFSIGFHEEKYNEAHHAKRVSQYLGTDHTEYYCTQQDALAILPKLAEIWDEPFGDASSIPTTLVSQLARQDVKVSLSADGGDEVFGGYSKYISIQRKIQTFSMIPSHAKPLTQSFLRNSLTHFLSEKFGMFDAKNRLNRFALMLNANESELLSLGSSVFTAPEINCLLKANFSVVHTDFDQRLEGAFLDNILSIDYATYQQDNILTKVDRATMSVGLEGREPLLDYRIVEFVSRLPTNFKINKNNKKYLLKKITHKYIPEEIMHRPKMGFGVPIFEWFRSELKSYLLRYLDADRLERAGIFDVAIVIDIRDRYLAGHKINVQKLWLLLMFEMWRERWM